MKLPKVAVIGCGYWGKNLTRIFHQLGTLATVCDVRKDVLEQVATTYGVDTTDRVDDVLNDPSIQALVIAAPAAQHFALTKAGLERDKDIYVEKPLSLTVSEGRILVDLALRKQRILMVGHILEYHPAIRELKRLIAAGELGKIRYIYSSRLNMGKLRTEENILWSFAPHDIAVILSLLKEFPAQITAQGGCYLNPHIADTTLTTAQFPSGVMAHIFVSWLHPFKEQKLCVVGDRSMAVFDDVEPKEKLVLYPHRIEWVDRVPVAKKEEGRPIVLPAQEPLREECQHFLECIRDRQNPLTDGESALRVLKVLDASEQSFHAQGKPISLVQKSMPYEAHPTAIIDEGSEIGKGTRIWHFSHIMSGSKIGEHCNLGQNVVVSPSCVLGNNVKVQNNVSIYTGVELEDDVFCGPSMVFTNVINPRSHIVRKNEYRRTLIGRGASLGANCTIVCGVTVGEYSFIAAGAVVSRDVPAYAMIMGVPGKQHGWVCYCGVRLPNEKDPICSRCDRAYVIEDNICKPISETVAESESSVAVSSID